MGNGEGVSIKGGKDGILYKYQWGGDPDGAWEKGENKK